MQIRRAEPIEAAEIKALTRQAYMPWVAVLGREPLPMNADYAAAFKDHRFDVIDHEGAITALIQTQPRGDSLWIENIAVNPSAQGKGYGRALLNHAEALAVQAGHTMLTLYTNKLMVKNIAIYKARGFVVTGEQVAAHGTIVWMAMQI